MAGTAIEYYGLSAFSVEHEESRFLVDPWFEPEWSGASPKEFDAVDYVLVTHGAHDHLGSTYPIAERTGATVVTEPAVADHLVARGLPDDQVTSLVWGNTLELKDATLRALETRHISYFESVDGPVSGTPLSFLFEFPAMTLYYMGDTAIFGDLELFGELYDPDVVMVPVGNAPGALAPLPPGEAALAVDMLGADVAVPVHFTPDSDAPSAFRERVSERDPDERINVVELDVGQRFAL